MKRVPDIIVIGAGAAGMAAAGELARQGCRVRVIEARDRLGGRICSARPKGWPHAVELGAEFVHGGNRALAGLIKAAGIKTRALAPNMWRFEKGRLIATPDFWERIGRVAARIPRDDRGWSFRQFLRHEGRKISPEDRRLTEAYVASFNAAPSDRISAHALRSHRAGTDTTDRKFVGRYDAVIRELRRQWPAGRVDLCLNTAVKRIEWKKGEVRVHTRGSNRGQEEVHCARAALVTLPLGVLQSRRVIFSPAPGARQKLIDRAGWGQVIRIVVRFKPGFWSAPFMPPALGAGRGRAFGFVNAPGESVPVWWALTAPAPVLVGWASGAAADRIRPPTPRVVRDAAVKSLAAIFHTTRAEVGRWIADCLSHDWRNDPFALGAYSFPVAGAEDVGQRLAEPVEKTLFFAGEALAADFGTVHGAIETGLEAARRATHALGRRNR